MEEILEGIYKEFFPEEHILTLWGEKTINRDEVYPTRVSGQSSGVMYGHVG